LGRQTTWTYDNLNNVTSERDAKLVTTTMTYDAKGNLLTRSRPLLNSAGATSATQKVTFNYGENGNPNSTTDPLGRVTTAAYDTLGRKTSTVSPRGTGWFANPAAYTTSYAYDWAGRLTRVTDPLGGATVRRYDRNGNLDLATDADNNTTTTYDYDAADQQITVVYSDGATPNVTVGGEGGLGPDAVVVVAGGVDLDLFVDLEPASGEGPEGVAHGHFRVGQVAGGLERGAGHDEPVIGERLKIAAQRVRA